MNKFIEKIKFWYVNSRPYSIPITFLSWLVIFCYSLKQGGNIVCGLIALVGISLVHLATNLSDDYFDFRRLKCDINYLNNSKEIKCRYLRNGQATIEDLRNVIILMLCVAAFCGGILFFMSGWQVVIFAFAVLPIAVLYSKLSAIGLGDLSVILAYGPLMFEGVYFVMTKQLSWEVFVLSIACSVFVNSILYAHMLMDYDEDVLSGKTTLCTLSGTKEKALRIICVFYITGYISMLLFGYITGNLWYFLTILTLPMVFDLYKLLKSYNIDKTFVPDVKFWYYPLDGWNQAKNTPNAAFLLRFMYTRNISTWFMLLTCFAILLY